MRDFLLSPILFLSFAIFFATLLYRRTGSIVSSSTVFTAFFSFGFAADRTAILVPTLVFIPLVIHDLFNAPPCVQISEGCYSEVAVSGASLTFFFFLLCCQWAFWTLVFFLFRRALASKRR